MRIFYNRNGTAALYSVNNAGHNLDYAYQTVTLNRNQSAKHLVLAGKLCAACVLRQALSEVKDSNLSRLVGASAPRKGKQAKTL